MNGIGRTLLCLVLLIFSVAGMLKGQEHKTYFHILNNAITEKDCEKDDDDCLAAALVWEGYYDDYSQMIKVQTDYLWNVPPTGLTSLNLWGAADAALNAWNDIVTNDDEEPLQVDNSSQGTNWWENHSVVHIVYSDDPAYFPVQEAANASHALDDLDIIYYNADYASNSITNDFEQSIIFMNTTDDFF